MREVVFKLKLFQSEAERKASEVVLRLFLEALTAADVAWLKFHPDTPKLYASGVVYRREQPRLKGLPIPEEWLQVPEILKQGWGDCEDLACWRAAELLCEGVAGTAPTFTWRRVGNLSVYHIMVKLPDGSIEDPSRRLGMPAIA